MQKTFHSIILLACLFLNPLAAEEERENDRSKNDYQETIKEYVVVTASGFREKYEEVVSPVHLLTGEAIGSSRAFALNDALNLAPGVLTLGTGGYGQASSGFVRGASAKHVLYMINNVRINDPAALSLDLATLSPGVFQQVEIVEGPYSGLYGSDAMGGTVNLVTGYEKGGSISLGMGGKSTYNGKVNIGLPLAGVGGLSLAYDHLRSAGDHLNSDFTSHNALLGLNLKHGSWSIEPFIYMNRAELGVPFNYGFASLNRRNETGLLALALPLHFQIDKKTALNFSSAYFRRRYELSDSDDPWNGDYKTRSDNFQFNARIMGKWLNEQSPSVFGVELNRARVDESSGGYAGFKDYAFNSASFWLQQVWQKKGWQLQVALRADSFQGNPLHFSPRFSIAHTWRLDKGLLLGFYAVNSYGFRAPKPAEVASPWGNPDLQPEKSVNFEGGLLLVSGPLSLRGGFFSTTFNDLVVFDYNTYKMANSSRDLVQGWHLQPRLALRDHFIALSYQNMTARNEVSGEALLRRPRHLLKAQVHLDFQRVYLSIFTRLVGARKDYDEITWSTVDADSFAVFTAIAAVRIQRNLSLYLKVMNLFDGHYDEIFGYRAPGRTAYIGLDIKI